MALTYTWTIKSLKKMDTTDLQNVVVHCSWILKGTDTDEVFGEFTGATPFDLNTVDPNNFTPFPDLTADIVQGWLEAIVVGAYKDHIDEQLQKQISAKRNPVTNVGEGSLPWAPAPAPTPNPA